VFIVPVPNDSKFLSKPPSEKYLNLACKGHGHNGGCLQYKHQVHGTLVSMLVDSALSLNSPTLSWTNIEKRIHAQIPSGKWGFTEI